MIRKHRPLNWLPACGGSAGKMRSVAGWPECGVDATIQVIRKRPTRYAAAVERMPLLECLSKSGREPQIPGGRSRDWQPLGLRHFNLALAGFQTILDEAAPRDAPLKTPVMAHGGDRDRSATPLIFAEQFRAESAMTKCPSNRGDSAPPATGDGRGRIAPRGASGTSAAKRDRCAATVPEEYGVDWGRTTIYS